MTHNRLVRPETPFYKKLTLIIFGIFLSLVLLEAGLRIGGFILLSLQEYRNKVSISKNGEYRIMCLGESTTLMPIGKDCYPSQLEEILNQHNAGIKFSVINKGLGGANTSQILSQLEDNLNKYNPNVVIAMMGINDDHRLLYAPYVKTKKSKNNLFLLLERFKIYKLIKLLQLRIEAKFDEMGIYKRDGDIEITALKSALYKSGITKQYVEQIKSFDSAAKPFENAIKNSTLDYDAYIGLGYLYELQGKFVQSEEIFKRAIQLYPQNQQAYSNLGILYGNKGDFADAEIIFKKLIAMNSNNEWAYLHLGWIYENQNNFIQAENAYIKSIELNPKNNRFYYELGKFYSTQAKFAQAIGMFKKALQFDPDDTNAYRGLILAYQGVQDYESVDNIAKMLDELCEKYVNIVTRQNDQKLKQILDRKGIRLVCVQYPMRSLESLKKMFDDPSGIIFVDNEKIFREVLIHGNIQDYFTDMFAGDFGHCTRKGNRLLAENIANTILKPLILKK